MGCEGKEMSVGICFWCYSKSRGSTEQGVDCAFLILARMTLSLVTLNAPDPKLCQQVAPEAAVW